MGRLKILTILFLITGTWASWILYVNYKGKSDTSNMALLAADSSTLSRVKMKYDTITTVIEKKANTWVVNNRYEARIGLIKLMIAGLTRAEVKRPVAEENKKAVLKTLSTQGVTVEAEGTNGWEKKFIICPNENDANSSYFVEQGSSEPSIIYVPGFTGDMVTLFKMDEANWRSRELFASTPMSLQKITLSYPAFPSSNVTIVWNSDKTFDVKGVKKVDTSRVITYLSQFEQVTVDAYIYNKKEEIQKKITAKKPQAILEVADIAPARSHIVSIYEECPEPKGIYAVVEPQNELVVIKAESLYRLLVRKDFFEKK